MKMQNTETPIATTGSPPLNSAEGEAIILLRQIADDLAAIRELGEQQLTIMMSIDHRMP
jgi:hypothetical protein